MKAGNSAGGMETTVLRIDSDMVTKGGDYFGRRSYSVLFLFITPSTSHWSENDGCYVAVRRAYFHPRRAQQFMAATMPIVCDDIQGPC